MAAIEMTMPRRSTNHLDSVTFTTRVAEHGAANGHHHTVQDKPLV